VPVKLRRLLLAVACVALCAPGCSWVCGKKQPGAADAAITHASVELLEPGAEPRQKLEVARWSGLSYEMSSESDGSFGIQGLPPAKAPTSLMTLRFEVVRGTADPLVRETDAGEVHLVEERATVREIGVKSEELPEAAIAQLNLGFGLLKGLTTRQLTGEDGEIFEVSAEEFRGQKLPPEIKKVLDQLLDTQRHFPFRLPHDPVGKGARWRFSEPLPMHHINTVQVADMTLNNITDTAVNIGIRVRLHADKQQVPHPTDPSIQASLDKYRGDAEGELVLDRETSVVLKSRLANTSVITLTWTDKQGQPQKSTFMSASTIRMKGRLGPFAADEAGDDADAGDAGAPVRDAAKD
jgi:hypothetical protein